MPGPAPKPAGTRRRRNAAPATRKLPPGGPSRPPPGWPLAGPDPVEAALWGELWAMPQAVVWWETGWTRSVARYVRWLVASETLSPADVPAAVLTELRQLEDRLGLTPMAMARLRWEVDDPPQPGDQPPPEPGPPSPHGPTPSQPPAARPPKRRVRAVDPGGTS